MRHNIVENMIGSSVFVDCQRILERTSAGGVPNGLVSVCVSLYNYSKFLPECLDSIRNQQYLPIELIIVDDASDRDDSVIVAQKWMENNASRFYRTLLLSHVKNQGLAQARNTAFANAVGEYVFVIDADNMIYPRAIARLYDAIKNTGASAAYTQLEFFGDERRLGYADVWMPGRFLQGNYVDAMALISKKTWYQVGGYTHIEGGWEDFDFWCKMIDMDLEGIFVPEILCRYRVHGTSMLRTETNKAQERLSVDMIMRHPWLRFGLPD